MSSRLPELERRILAIGGDAAHHEVYHFLQHGIRALRDLEATLQQEILKKKEELEMHTVHTVIDRSITELVDILEKTIEDWEHRFEKSKKNFADGVE